MYNQTVMQIICKKKMCNLLKFFGIQIIPYICKKNKVMLRIKHIQKKQNSQSYWLMRQGMGFVFLPGH
jgi:hypothetical protein